MTVFHRLSLAVMAAILPLAVLAQEVPNVSGIRADVQDGNVTVYWDPVEGDVKKFRIFYSHASILEQGGVYDDYEDAAGDALQHTLSSVPPVSTLYVSVLAVGQDDAESPFFMEEATVELAPSSEAPEMEQQDSSAAAFAPSPTVAMQSSTLQLLTAISTSATGVTLTFTHPLSVPEQFKDAAFSIKSGSGQELPIARYTLVGNQALLDTGLQTAGRVYQVTIHGSIAGKTADGEIVPQEASTAPLLFTGLRTDTSVPEVTNLTLKIKGTDVEATWTPPAATVRELQVQQSTNGGRTFGTAVRMDKAARGVTIPNVANGTFTLLVRVVGLDGSVSRGTQQTVTIGNAVASSSSSKPATTSSSKSSASSKPSTTPGTKPGTLPSSGLGLTAIVGLSGAATGMRFFRKKNVAKA
jgi:hypothetical protein